MKTITISKHHATPQIDFDKFGSLPTSTIVAEAEDRFVALGTGPDWLARSTRTAPRVLMFSAFRNDHWLGDFTSLEAAVTAAGI